MNLHRWIRAFVLTATAVTVGSAGLALNAMPSASATAIAGTAQIVNPSNAAPLSTGGSATSFTLKLPNGSACTGDSAASGYRINSYIVPQSVPLDSLKFNADGPVPATGQFRGPLYDTGQSPYVQIQTANAVPAGGPGPIIQPLPAFNFAVYDTTTFPIPPGVYNLGIACTLGAETSATQLDKYWNAVMTITADASDPGPAKIKWVATAATPAQISGTVTEVGSGLPLAGVCVYLHDTAGVRTTDVGTCTGASGTYTMAVASPGSYKVAFFDPSSVHVTQWFNNQPSAAAATPVTVGSGATTAINAAMALTGPSVITGTITSAQGGAPLAGICAYLYDATTNARTGDFGTCSNAQGSYRMAVGAPGSYKVGFLDPAGVRITQWANGKPTQAAADPITVTAGRVTPGVNASMVATGSISGTVSATGGGGFAGVCVYADDLSGVYSGLGGCTNAAGLYTIAGFVPGPYKLGFYLPGQAQGPGATPTTLWYNNKGTEATADAVVVNPGAITSGVNQTFTP